MNKFSILVAGDVCDDIYLFSNEKKTNPEHSSPIYKISSKFVRPGMSLNIQQNLYNMNVTPGLLHNSKTRIQKTRLYYNNEYISRIDDDSFEPIDSNKFLCKQVIANLSYYDGIIVSDYGKGFWTKETLSVLNDTEKLVFIDPYATTSLAHYPKCFCITPNYEEGKALTGETSYNKICEKIAQVVNCEYVVLKVGEKGSFLYKKGWEAPILFPAVPVKCIDPCGAGDTFIAALSAHYMQNGNITDAIICANRAASLTVNQLGVYSPTQEEWKNINEKV